MRVIAGSARRLLLVTPPGLDTRPTQDKIKETLFNILQMQVPGSVFLDICAGSGGIGIEAISRGARRAYFIENGRAAISCIQQNLHKTGFEDQAVILRQDAVAALRQVHEKEVDLVYLDPPYKSDLARRILTALDGQSYITEDTCIVVETDLDSDFSFLDDTGFEIYREKDYRSNRHLFIRRKIMPVANRYTIAELMEAGKYYFDMTGRQVTFEYSLIRDVNDSAQDAQMLAELARPLKAHINLIPVNPVKERGYRQTQEEGVRAFEKKLEKRGINVSIRRVLGRDIDGACGQLRHRHLSDQKPGE